MREYFFLHGNEPHLTLLQRADSHKGRAYYELHGRPLHLPDKLLDQPAREFLCWHQEHEFARSG